MNILIRHWLDEWETDSLLSSLITLRRTVFVVEQLCPIEDEPDPHDPTALHVCAVVDGTVIGCARILTADPSVAKIGRVAVSRDARKA